MSSKPFRALLMLGAAFGIPYVWFNPHVSGMLQTKWREARAAFGGRSLSLSSSESFVGGGSADGRSAAGQALGLEEFLRFDVTPRWILDQWPRVSTVRARAGSGGTAPPRSSRARI